LNDRANHLYFLTAKQLIAIATHTSLHTNTAHLGHLIWDVAGAVVKTLQKQTDKKNDKTPIPWSKAVVKMMLLFDCLHILQNQ